MSFNGSGTFNINSTGQPVVTGSVISSTAFNALTADLGTGLSNAICKDGQSTPTANIKMGTFKITGLGSPAMAGDALCWGSAATVAALTCTTVNGSGLATFDSIFVTNTATSSGGSLITTAQATALAIALAIAFAVAL